MSETLFALLDFGLVFGAVLAFGFWQLWLLRRDRRTAVSRTAEPKRDA